MADDPVRILIIGNCGSGKSWLALRIGLKFAIPVHHLDDVHWQPGQPGIPREKPVALADVRAIAQSKDWVIEGVYGWLAEAAFDRATILIWLDLPVAECLENIRLRGPQNAEDQSAFDALLAWTGDYESRPSSSGYAAHRDLYSRFPGRKYRLDRRDAVSRFADQLR